jgi:hypothetical protein
VGPLLAMKNVAPEKGASPVAAVAEPGKGGEGVSPRAPEVAGLAKGRGVWRGVSRGAPEFAEAGEGGEGVPRGAAESSP